MLKEYNWVNDQTWVPIQAVFRTRTGRVVLLVRRTVAVLGDKVVQLIAPSNDSRKLQAHIVRSVVATSSLDHSRHLRLMLLLTTCKLSLLL